MLLHELVESLKITPVPAENPEIDVNFLLDAEGLTEQAVRAGLAPDIARQLRTEADKLCSNAVLSSYFNFLAVRLFNDRLSADAEGLLPQSIGILSEAGQYTFFALLAVSAFASRRRVFTSAGFPADSADGAIRDVLIWIDHFHRNRGLAGISNRILNWEYHVLNASPLTLGRLQFVLKPFTGKVHVFRHRTTGRVQALASPGVRFNRAGMIDGVNDDFDPVAWTSSLEETPRAITGNPVTPGGKALRELMTLDTADWKVVFREGDWTLDTHIPEGHDLQLADCQAAMQRALGFFTQRYPDRTIRAFSCLSWLLDPQYEFLLKPDSRILGFMHQYYLFPLEEGGEDAGWRIFGEEGLNKGLENAPRNTSMQRSVADFLERGGKLRSGGGFLLPEELTGYGKAPYRVAPAAAE